jgi:hypothetical protein
MNNYLKNFFITVFCNFLLLSPFNLAGGETSDNLQWKSLETEYVILKYQLEEDLKKFHKKVDYAQERRGIKSLFGGSSSDNLEGNIRTKIDALYERVQEVLGMHRKVNKVTIVVYHDKKQLGDSYSKICSDTALTYGHSPVPRAFFIYSFNSIYVTAQDVHEGILAHEIAHSIVDNFLRIRPPKATAEILARYVDKHLVD